MIDKLKAAIAGHPASAELRKIAAAEQRCSALEGKLTEVLRQHREAERALVDLEADAASPEADLTTAATAYAARHAELNATIRFCTQLTPKLRAELVTARTELADAERKAVDITHRHFTAASEALASKVADAIRADLIQLGALMTRSDSFPTRAEDVVKYLSRFLKLPDVGAIPYLVGVRS